MSRARMMRRWFRHGDMQQNMRRRTERWMKRRGTERVQCDFLIARGHRGPTMLQTALLIEALAPAPRKRKREATR